jgi:hypothetical protein
MDAEEKRKYNREYGREYRHKRWLMGYKRKRKKNDGGSWLGQIEWDWREFDNFFIQDPYVGI